MGLFGDLTRSDVGASLAEIRLTDLAHALAPAAAIVGGWSGLMSYLAAFAVLQVIQLVRSNFEARVIGDTLIDVTITVLSGAFVTLAVPPEWPLFIWQGWVGAGASMAAVGAAQRLRA